MSLRNVVVLLCGAVLAGSAQADTSFGRASEVDVDAPAWSEEDVPLPPFPQEASLVQFYVSEVTTHKFYIDPTSLSVGKDGVVRYVLVVRTSGGATNISFEGIRCETLELKVMATGRQDGSWAKARNTKWRPIENKPVNRQHAALSREFFCPNGVVIQSPAEGRNALRLGRHPSVSNYNP